MLGGWFSSDGPLGSCLFLVSCIRPFGYRDWVGAGFDLWRRMTASPRFFLDGIYLAGTVGSLIDRLWLLPSFSNIKISRLR